MKLLRREFSVVPRSENHDTEKAIKEILADREKAKIPIEGELKKSKENIETINKVNTLLEKEFANLGIENYVAIDPKQIHLLNDNDFLRENEGVNSVDNFVGTADSWDGLILINVDKSRDSFTKDSLDDNDGVEDPRQYLRKGRLPVPGWKLYYKYYKQGVKEFGKPANKDNTDPLYRKIHRKSLKQARNETIEAYENRHLTYQDYALKNIFAHEMLHIASHAKMREMEEGYENTYRSGYTVRNIDKDKEFYKLFTVINEAVTQKLSEELLIENSFEFENHLLIDRDGLAFENAVSGAYGVSVGLLRTIMYRIAKAENIDTDEVWKRFKKSYFTGEMMHLRSIDKVFGKGALRLLANLDVDKLETGVYQHVGWFFAKTGGTDLSLVTEEVFIEDTDQKSRLLKRLEQENNDANRLREIRDELN